MVFWAGSPGTVLFPSIPCRHAMLNRSHCSILSLCLKVLFLLLMIWVSNGFCFNLLNGTCWPNFAFTQTTPLFFFSSNYGASAINCAIFNETPMVHSILKNYLVKLCKGRGGKWPMSILAVKRKNHNWPWCQRRKLNLDTYKFHALRGYVRMIKLFSMTDLFTTQVVSLSLEYFYITNVNISMGQAGALPDQEDVWSVKQERSWHPICKTKVSSHSSQMIAAAGPISQCTSARDWCISDVASPDDKLGMKRQHIQSPGVPCQPHSWPHYPSK